MSHVTYQQGGLTVETELDAKGRPIRYTLSRGGAPLSVRDVRSFTAPPAVRNHGATRERLGVALFADYVAQYRGTSAVVRSARLAVAYEAAVAEGVTEPSKALAAAANIDLAAARRRIADARLRGMLTSDGAGYAGGRATDKAKALVA